MSCASSRKGSRTTELAPGTAEGKRGGGSVFCFCAFVAKRGHQGMWRSAPPTLKAAPMMPTSAIVSLAWGRTKRSCANWRPMLCACRAEGHSCAGPYLPRGALISLLALINTTCPGDADLDISVSELPGKWREADGPACLLICRFTTSIFSKRHGRRRGACQRKYPASTSQQATWLRVRAA